MQLSKVDESHLVAIAAECSVLTRLENDCCPNWEPTMKMDPGADSARVPRFGTPIKNFWFKYSTEISQIKPRAAA